MEAPGRGSQWRCDSNATKIIIPAWVTELTWNSFERAAKVEEIRFEAGSQLRELDFYLLSACKSLKSIYMPTSIEVIRLCSSENEDCDFPLERVTFEAGSRLREIQTCSFSHCRSLKSICLPASVQSMDGRSFLFSSLREICIESGNPFFRVSWPFLLDFEGSRIVRYFGDETEVTIPRDIETLGSSSFSCCDISTIRFESMSKLSLIDRNTFSFCQYLQSISIPSSVTILHASCFAICSLLQIVSFEPDSQLVSIGDSAFRHCFALKSIVLPSRLEIIGKSCFRDCTKLESIIFASDSKLVRIEAQAFGYCLCLKSFFLPPLLEFIGENCFSGSSSFSILTFASPSRLQELLDVPVLWRGFEAIPDSVEVLQLCPSRGGPPSCTLTFGDDSRLRMVRTNADSEVQSIQSYVPLFRYFVRVSSRSLKMIRSNLEFDGL
jgi:hypothetical protein